MIESLDNKKVKEWMKLHEKKYRDETNLFLIEDKHLINEAKKYNIIQEIISIEEIEEQNITIHLVSKRIMAKLSKQNTSSKIIAVCKKLEEKEIGNKVLILDQIQDPGNLGTMIRSAVAFHFDTIIMSTDSVDLYNEKVIRATEGMLFHINIIRAELLDYLAKMTDYQLFRTDVENGVNVKNIEFMDKVAIIIGNEGKGIQSSIKEKIKNAIYIPMNENCESLNAAISASIIMYEVGR